MTRGSDRYADGIHISARRRQKAALLAEALGELFQGEEALEIIDFGCADGAVPVLLLQSDFGSRIRRITGITLLDYNDLPEKPAHEHPRFLRLIGDLSASIDDLPLPWGQCDAVLATAFFHYLATPETAFTHAARLLKPGGYLLAGMPAPWVLALRRQGIPGVLAPNRRIARIEHPDAWARIAASCGFTERSRCAAQWLGLDGTSAVEHCLRRLSLPHWCASHALMIYRNGSAS